MQTEQVVATFWIGSVGFPELLVIVLVALLVFGGKRLGDIGRGLGEGIRNFKSAVGDKDEKSVEAGKNPKAS